LFTADPDRKMLRNESRLPRTRGLAAEDFSPCASST